MDRQFRVSFAHYPEYQAELGKRLKRRPGEGWDYEGLEWSDLAGSYDGVGYPTLLPLVLVRRGGNDLRLTAQRALAHPSTNAWRDRCLERWSWDVSEVRIDVFDFGVGVIECTCSFTTPDGLHVNDVRRIVESLSHLKPDPRRGPTPLASALESLTRETTNVLAQETGPKGENFTDDP